MSHCQFSNRRVGVGSESLAVNGKSLLRLWLTQQEYPTGGLSSRPQLPMAAPQAQPDLIWKPGSQPRGSVQALGLSARIRLRPLEAGAVRAVEAAPAEDVGIRGS